MREEFIRFELVGNTESGKTQIYKVISTQDNWVLGMIRWYGAWRRYVFRPASECVFDSSCLKHIQEFLDRLMKERTTPASEAEPGGKISPCTTVTEEKIVKQEKP